VLEWSDRYLPEAASNVSAMAPGKSFDAANNNVLNNANLKLGYMNTFFKGTKYDRHQIYYIVQP